MTEATDGYRAAIRDLQTLVASRGLMTPGLVELFADLEHDALVIEHEQGNKLQRRRLKAQREAMPRQELLL